MIPLGDDNPTRIAPIITWVLIIVNIVVFIWEMLLDPRTYEQMIQKYGFVPILVTSGKAYYTFLTSMFLHGGILHLAGNMWYMHVFGDNVEDLCGYVPYLVFYLICGFVGSLFQLAAEWGSSIPSIGASGAISGLLGAYIYLFPNVRIRTAITWGFFMRITRLPAYYLIGFWFLYQLLLGMLASDMSVAYWAHIGGFVAGLALARIFVRRREVHPLFQTPYVGYG
jgi:membrane associated rhomboid family serine protease